MATGATAARRMEVLGGRQADRRTQAFVAWLRRARLESERLAQDAEDFPGLQLDFKRRLRVLDSESRACFRRSRDWTETAEDILEDVQAEFKELEAGDEGLATLRATSKAFLVSAMRPSHAEVAREYPVGVFETCSCVYLKSTVCVALESIGLWPSPSKKLCKTKLWTCLDCQTLLQEHLKEWEEIQASFYRLKERWEAFEKDVAKAQGQLKGVS